MRRIEPERGPEAIGPYSPAVEKGGMLFISGQIPVDPETGTVVKGIEPATRRIFENVKIILKEAGYSLQDVVKVTVYLKNLQDFGVFNRVYAEYLGDVKPARTTVEVSSLPKGVEIEMDFIAVK